MKEEFIEAEQLLKRPTPFWMKNGTNILLCVRVVKSNANIALYFLVGHSSLQTTIHDSNITNFSYSKWNKIELITPSPKKKQQIIRGLFEDTK